MYCVQCTVMKGKMSLKYTVWILHCLIVVYSYERENEFEVYCVNRILSECSVQCTVYSV